jgi:hypothetical protein
MSSVVDLPAGRTEVRSPPAAAYTWRMDSPQPNSIPRLEISLSLASYPR